MNKENPLKTSLKGNYSNFAGLKKKSVLISFSVGVLMLFGKLGAYFLTNSAAILSDAFESIVHIIAVSFVLYSLLLSLKPASKVYPYGYGKIEYFSAGFEGALIIIAAVSIIAYAIRDIIFGSEIKQLDIGALIILAASIINLILGFYLVRMGKKTRSLILFADGKHILTDSYTSFGVVVGVLIVMFTGIMVIDPIIAIAVALNILFTGAKLIKQSIGGLMNRTEIEMITKIANVLNSYKINPDWIDIHLLRYWKSGDRYFVDFHITMPYYLSVQKSHDYNTHLHQIFKEIFETDTVDMIMHIDPCVPPEYCRICRKADCPVRQAEHSKDIIWDSTKIVSKVSYLNIPDPTEED